MESSIIDALTKAGQRPAETAERGDKKNYAERLSSCAAFSPPDRLRPSFPEYSPGQDGRRLRKTPARTAKGFKKLDVNYSTTELGMGLGVSIKTVTARDPRTRRYTKNYTDVSDAELRAEAVDYHKRQPFAVMVALIFLPIDACARLIQGPYGSGVESRRNGTFVVWSRSAALPLPRRPAGPSERSGFV